MFIGLTPDGEDSLEDTEAFLEEFGIGWANGYGARNTLAALGVQTLPSLLVIGADGKVAWNDELPGEVDQAIEQALSGGDRSL